MILETLSKWIYEKVSNYNLFMLEENDYDEDDGLNDPAIVLKHQKYKTRLYIVLFIVKIESKTVVVYNITLDIFDGLSFKYGQNLLCPCTTTTIPLENFVSNDISIHPVCQSYFIDSEWIDGLYFKNASSFVNWDFRKTAYSQFKILSQFCSLAKETIIQIQQNVNKTQFITIELLSKLQVELEVDAHVQFHKNIALGQMISFLNYLKTTITGNNFVSALGTNHIFSVESGMTNTHRAFSQALTLAISELSVVDPCGVYGFTMATAFTSLSIDEIYISVGPMIAIRDIPNSTSIVDGFFTSCTPFESILESTLDCLYQTECLIWLSSYFPKLKQVRIL
ncbi:unnamed protein product [Adineta ricciae]|uniref:Uncharacterized protein n=1 Tax=Adineta ricciae TaxID=249248 RepID=A0A815JAS6_ADIRI|nr:unnamed protein product [Adineta ricciae]